MRSAIHLVIVSVTVVLLGMVGNTSAIAQEGTLHLHVTPPHAYVFVDGRAIGEASKRHTLKLSPGDHKVELVNYGFAPANRNVTIAQGQTSNLEVSLTPVSSSVSGPFGAMTIEGPGRDAVLLNGKTPDFFVGHVDEFNHEWWWKQELVVPPGKYQVTVLSADKEAWSGPVEVPVNQRVVIDVPKGVRKTVTWSRGEKLTSLPRFTSGTASATVAVAKPTAQLSASTAQINCGDSSQLKWTSTDAPQVEIAPMGQVSNSGEQAVQPKQTTDYQLTALGPGGTVTSSATVNVNTAVQANLGLSPAQIQYKRIGDKVMQEGSTVLNWTSANASTVSINPLGTVGSNGNQTLQIKPQKTDPGSVDETVTYTLKAANECGGTTTQTATLHIVGSIEPPPELAMRSIYFQTDVPTAQGAENGLLPGEQETLKTIAESFTRYVAITPGARLSLSGHADERGPDEYNKSLSDRRVQLVKAFLTQQGVSADALDTQALGKEQNLSTDEVKQLIQQNPNLSDEERQKDMWRLKTIVLANNRRVDITLSPTGQQSLREYPFKAEDFARLIDRNGPVVKEAGSAVQPAAKKEKISN
ncbi:MAG TPA: OmpA family protein [Terriglobales bacterium]|nr:OmpA family protein [Terriglobales bacterium]